MMKTSTRNFASIFGATASKRVWYFSLFLMLFSFAIKPIAAYAEGSISKKQIEQLVKESQNSISFIENKGQWPGSVKMRGTSNTGEILIKDDNIHFLSYKKEEHEEEHEGESEEHEEEYEVEVHQWAIFFDGMNKKYTTIKKSELPTKRNYYLGDDKSLYKTDVASYGEVVMADIYQGIDLRLYSQKAGLLEFDWVVDAGADYKNIRMRFKGPENLKLDDQGRLCIGLEFNTIKFDMPECYQVINGKKQLLRFKFNIGKDNVVTFDAIDKVDNRYALVIDPDLRWGTLFDGNNNTIFDEYLFATDVDNQGNVYCGGAVNLQFTNAYISTSLYGYDPTYNGPGTGGSNNGNRDGILYKISQDGTEVTNITYFGSTSQDVIYGLSLSPDRSTVFISGKTNGSIPTAGTSATSFDNSKSTGYDGFVAAFNASTFSNLLYSSYIGGTGSSDDEIVTIRSLSNNSYVIGGRIDGALDAAYISNAYDASYSGSDEGYIAKFQNWNSLVFGTYVGGNSNDQINDLNVFSDGAIVFSGFTESTSNFPSLVNGASSNGNNRDGIVGVVPANGGNFNMLSRIGGSAADEFYGLTIGFSDTIFLTGYTSSTNFPLGVGASASNRYDISANGAIDGILAKIPRQGQLLGQDPWVATYFGGSGDDRANTIKRYTPLAIMVYGETKSTGLPTKNLATGGAFYQATKPGGGSWDMFFVTMGNDLNTLYYSTYAGGSNDDYIGETGIPRGSNHMFIVGDSLVGVGTTTHSNLINTFSPNLIGPRTGALAVFDTAKATNDDSHLVFEWRLLNNFFNFDYGDAPSSYGTPKHGILQNLKLGTKVDNEDFFPAAPGTKANYDDNNTTVGVTDDEDGINASQVLVQDSATFFSISVAVTNTTGSIAYASAWIDFNKNGTFENNELSKVNVANNATSVTFNWTSISGFSAGTNDTSYMRVRITQDPSFNVTFPSATADAQTGEIEDYLVVRYHCVDLSAAVINVTNPTTCGGGNGSITIQNSNLIPGVTYTVYYRRNNGATQGPFTLTTANGGIFTIPNLQAGAYTTIQVFHPTNPLCGDTLTGPITLVDPAAPAAPSVGANPNPICTGNTLSLSVTGVPGATYSWTGPNGFSSTAQNPTIAITATNQGGTYSVTQTLNNCTSPAGTVNVTVNTTPAAPTVSSNSPVCAGGTLNLSATGTGTSGFSWTGPNSFASNVQNPSIPGVTIAAAGTYVVRQTINGCPSATASTVVVINSAPAAPTASSNSPVCVGDAIQLSTPAVSGAIYNWTGPASFTSSVQNPTRSGATTAFAGTYTITTTTNNCTSLPGSVTVVVNTLPTITSATGANPTTCLGTNGSITLSGSIVAGQQYTVTYLRNGSNQTATLTANGSAQIVITGLNAASYSNFRITLISTTCSSSVFAGPVVLTDPNSPSTPTPTNNGPVCVGDSIKLFAPTISGATYSWTGPAGFTSALQNPTRANATIGFGGVYSVAVTVNNCTSNPGSTTVIVNAPPVLLTAIGVSPIICAGNQGFITLGGTIVAGQQYSVTYERSNVSQGPITVTANVLAELVISGLNAGSYGNFKIQSSNTGCTSNTLAGPVVLTDPIAPLTPVATSNSPVCEGDTIKLFTSTVALATYSWTGPAGFSSTSEDPIRLNATTAFAGNYSVVVTVAGCASPPGTVSVTVNTKPVTTSATGSNPTTCGGSQGSITLSGLVSGVQYTIGYQRNSVGQSAVALTANGAGQVTITGLNAGTYTNFVATRVGTGCVSMPFFGPVTLSDPTTPFPPSVSSNSPRCYGDTVKLVASTVAGATYSWTGPNGYTSALQSPVIPAATPAISGTYSVVATVNNCTSVPATVNVVVNSCPPVAVDDAYTTPEDVTLNVPAPGILTNDYDPANPQQPITVTTTPVCNVKHGTVILAANGGFTYTPSLNYNGKDTFCYRICDNEIPAACDTAIVVLTITPVNDPPVVPDTLVTTPEDVPKVICVPITDPEIPGQSHLVTVCGAPTKGTISSPATINNPFSPRSLCLTYTPNTNFNGLDSICLVICDNGSPILCDTSKIRITVTPINDPPVAINDTFTTPRNTPITGNIRNNDSDSDAGDTLTVTPITTPSHGTVTVSTNGVITYTPTTNFYGLDSFRYRVCDKGIPAPTLCDTATVYVNVTYINYPPIVPDTIVRVPEDSTIIICAPIFDVDDTIQTHTFTVCGNPVNGLVTSGPSINNPGVPRSVCLTYKPNLNFNGKDSICLVICDNGTPSLCDTTRIRITVDPVNDKPIAINDTFNTPRNTPITGVNIRNNDSDPDAGDTLTVTTITSPVHGTVTVSTNGGMVYTPATNFFGRDSFQYRVCDKGIPAPVLCDTATVIININFVNYPPIVPDTLVRVPEDSTITVCVPISDVDVAIQNHAFSICGNPVNGIVTSGPTINNPSDPRSLCLTYKPNPNYNGKDSICLIVCDNGTPSLCDTTKIRITIDPVNDKPIAINDTFNILEDQIATGNIRNNDSDPDAGDTLTVTQITTPIHGTVTVTTTGNIIYTPNPNYFGTDSFQYRVCDKGVPAPVLCDTATVIINITQVNDPPVVRDTLVTTNEDTPKQICVPILDNDVADSHNAVILQNTVNGTLSGGSVNNTGTPHSFCATYTPNPNFNGNDSFKIVVCDNGLPILCDTATIRIIVVPVNDPPVAVDDFFNGSEDDPINGTVITNDSDPDGDIITVTTTPICNPKHGTVVLSANGDFIYDPVPNYNGNDTFCYRICDNGTPVLCDTAKVYISLNDVNDPPIAVDDRFTTPEDVILNGNMKPNDIDPDGDSLIYATTPVTGPVNGTVVINPTGTFTYTPNLNYNGQDSFKYSVCDNGTPTLCDSAMVYITITPVNDKPNIPDSTVNTPENTPITVCLPITDPEAFDSHIGSVCSLPLHGTFGVPVVNNASNPHSLCIIYTPNPGYSGKDSFCVQICDNGFPSLCDIGIITIVIAPVNHKPDAVNDIYVTKEDSAFTSNVRGNDTDPDFGTGDSLTITQLTTPLHGTVSPVSSTGTFTYTPNANYNGVDSFRYVACDRGIPAPVLCDTATVIITILPVNDKPFVPDTLVNTPEGTPKTVCLPITDLEIPSDLHNVTVCGGPVNGTISSTPVVNNPFDPRSVCLTYTPNTGFRGLDSICLIVCDNGIPSLCDTATVRINVTPVNHKPDAINDPYTTKEDSAFIANVRGNDTDPDFPYGDSLTITQLTNPINGTVTGVSSTGTFTYTPNANYNGVDSFRYVACDRGIPAPVLCDTATVIITILPVNDKPLIPDTLVNTPQGTPKTVCLPITDPELPTDVHIATICGGPLNGTITSSPVVNNPFVPRSLCLTYTPNASFRGLDSICVIVCDNGTPSLCDTATVRINVSPVNRPPDAVNDVYTINEDSTFTANVRSNDTDPDFPNGDSLTITQLTNPIHGTVTGVSSTGTFTYTPTLNYNGVDSFRYVACDRGIPSPVLCDTATVIITILPVNDKPFIPDTLVNTPQGTPKTVCLPITDPELPTDLHFSAICGGPLNGTITASPVVNNPFVPRSLCLTYTPNASFRGIDSICVIVCDNGTPSLCDTATVRINVSPVNRPPDAVNDVYTINEDSTFTANVRGNDTDPDFPNGDSLTITQLTNPIHGTVTGVSSTGTFTYTPTLNYNGVDSFRYVACDRGIPTPVLCDTATVIITILPINDKPFIPDTLVSTPEDTPITVCLPITDPELTTQFFFPLNCGAPLHGSISPLNVNNPLLPRILCATYTPTPNFNGLDSFCVIVCDNGNPSLCDTAIVTIRITPVNDPPVAVNDVYSTPEDVILNGNVRGNDTDPDYPYGDTLTITPLTNPLHGTVTVTPNGDFAYTPTPNFNGTDSFQYVACDKGQPAPVLCDTATVFITIIPVNDPPVAVNDTASGNTNIAIPINVSNNDYDIDGVIVPSTTTVITTPAQGTVVNNGNGNVTYTSVYGYVGQDSFQYRICDNGMPVLCDTATVYVNVIQRTITVTTTPICSLDAAYLTYTLVSNNPQPSDRISIQWIGATGNLVATYDSLPVTGTVRWPGAIVDANGNGIDWPGYVYNGTSWVAGADGFEGLIPQAKLVFKLNPTDTVIVTYPPSTAPTCYTTPPPGPTAVNDSATTPEETPVTVPVLRNDFDNKYGLDSTSVAVVTTPAHGTVTVNPNGTITYTPNTNYNGRDTFNYKVCNKAFYTLCDTATVYINVTPVNDPPFVPDTLVTTPEDTPITVCIKITDIDSSDNHSASICNVPRHGTLTAGPTANNSGLPHQFCYTYTPNLNFYGKDTVCVIVCDNGTPQLCDTSVTIITVTPNNDPPYADTVRVTTYVEVSVPVNTSSATGDPESDPLTYTYGTPTVPGTVVTVTSVGGIVVTPPAGFDGVITIPYKVCDNAQYAVTPLCDSSVIIVTVIPNTDPNLNHPPVANNDYATTNKNEPAVINVKSNDSDVDGDSLSVTISSVPANGNVSVNANGTVTYTPNPGFVGKDTFYYIVCDPFGTTAPRPLCDDARVIVTITDMPNTSGNRPPAAVDDLAIICSSNTVVLDLLKNDSDPDGDAITFLAIIKAPSNGVASQVFTGGYKYTPNSGFNGLDTFTYRICDNGVPSLCDTANAIIRVTSAPVLAANPSSLTICSADSVKIDITSIPASAVTWTATNGTSGFGNVRTTLINNGLSDIAVVYTFVGNFNGCTSQPLVVPVTVKPRPQAFALPSANQVCSGEPVTIVMSSNFTGTSYIWSATNGHSGSGVNIIDTLTNNGIVDSNVTYTIIPTFNGCSGLPALVNVLVKPRPVLTLGSAPDTVCSNTQLTINATSNVAGTNFTWTGTNGSSGTGVPVIDIPVNLAGLPVKVTYTITSANGVCAGNSVQKTVVVNPRPVADGGPNLTAENCPLSTVVLGGTPSASGGIPPYTTIWNPSTALNDSSLANPTATGLSIDAVYVLTVTDRNGCTATDVVNVTVVPSTLRSEAGNNAAYCFGSGSSVTLGGIPTAVGGKTPYSYRWYPGLGLSDSTAANPSASPSVTTKYFVEAKDANGCSYTDSVVITVNPVPVAQAGNDTALCSTFGTVIGGNPTATSGTAPYSYSWTPSTGLSANNIANPTAAPNITTTYNVVVRDANGCTGTDAVIITINALPIANAGPDVTTTGCASDSVQLGGTPSATSGSAPYTYLWQPTTGLTDTSIARPFVKGLNNTALYSLLVTDSKGCTATDVVLVSVTPSTLRAEAGNNLRYCKGSSTIVTLGGTPTAAGGAAPFVYTWSDASLGNVANPLVGPDSTTTYRLTVTDAKGCSSFDSVTITVNPKPIANAGADSAICFNSPIRLGTEQVASSGTPPYTYLWSPGQGLSATTVARPVATPTATTTYNVLVTDANGCTNTDQITVTVRTRPIADAGVDKTLTACSSDSVQLGGTPAANSGTAPYTYLWAPTAGLKDSTIANPWVKLLGASTLYTLTVTDANGCTNTDQVNVTVTGSSLVVEAGNNAAFCAGTNGSAVLGGAPTVTGGTAPYSYAWSPDSSLNLTNITNPIASPVTTTIYTVLVTDAKGCQASDTVRVTVYEAPTANAGVNDTICFGTSKVLGGNPTASGGKAPYTYSWSPAGVTPANAANPTANPTGTTAYTVTVRDANGCTATASKTVFVAPSLTADAGLNQSVTGCNNDSITIGGSPTATGGLGAYSYAWTPATGLSGTNVANPIVKGITNSTVYALTVTDGIGCTATDIVTVVYTPSTLRAHAGEDTIICAGTRFGVQLGAIPTATGGKAPYTYMWSPTTGLNNSTSPNPLARPSSTTTYELLVTDGNGCTSIDSVIVRVNGQINLTVGADTAICLGSSVRLGADTIARGGTAPYTYSWTPSTGLSSVTVPNPLAQPTVTTTYIVLVTDAVGCTNQTAQGIVVNPVPTADAGADQSIVACGAASITIGGSPSASNGTPGYTYNWSPATGLSAVNASNPQVDSIFTSINYTLVVTDRKGCTATDAVFVTVVPTTLSADAGANRQICAGDTAVGIIIGGIPTAIGGALPYTYAWSGAGLTNGNKANPVARPAVTTTYYVTVTDANGCGSVDSITITVNPTPTVNAGKDTAVCSTFAVTLGAAPTTTGGTAPYTYSWTPGSGLSDASSSNPIATPSTTSTYTVVVRDANSCTATDAVTVTVKPAPLADAGTDQSLVSCSSDSVTIGGSPTAKNGSSPYTYLWSPGGYTTANPVVKNLGATTTFEVTVTDNTGCTATDQVVVFVSGSTLTVEAGNGGYICAGSGSTIQLGGIPTVVGGSLPYKYQWTPNAGLNADTVANPIAQPISTTKYTVLVTDANGCQASDTVVVTVRPKPVVDFTRDSAVCVDRGLVTLVGIPAGGTFSGTGVTGNSFQPSLGGAGVYTITYNYTDAFGCTNSISKTITVNPLPVVDITGNNTFYCANEKADTLVGVPAGGKFTGTGVDSAGVFTPANASVGNNVLTYTYKDVNGCVNSKSITIEVRPAPTVNLVANDDSVCINTPVTLSATFSNNVFNLQWYDINGTYLQSGLAPIVVTPTRMDHGYVVFGTNTVGCTTSDTVIIHVNQAPVAEADTANTCEEEPVFVDVIVNDTDLEGNANVLTIATAALNGTTTISNGVILYTPNLNFNGTDRFSYSICNTQCAKDCDTAFVLVNICSINDTPTIPLVVDSIPEDSTIVICPAVFDADTDNLVVTTYACSAIHGTVTNVTDTCIRYTPTPNWYGTDTICTVVCDPFNACDTNKIVIIVTPRNEPPVADTVIVVTLINTPVPVNVSSAVFDINSDPVSFTYGTPSEPGTVVTITTNGGIVVTPPTGFTGTITIPYTVCDAAQYPVTPLCDTSIIIVYVIDTPKGNLPPIANNDHEVVPPGGTANIPVLANDYDPNGDPISIVGIIPGSGPSNGVITNITGGPTPTIIYVPNPGFDGCDTFRYSITDPFGLMDTAMVTVCVSSVPVDVNLPPVAVNDFDTTNYLTPVIIPVKINDSDPDGDIITTTGIIGSTHGTATINPNGTVTFSPDSTANANTPGTFCYSICDNGVPSLCDTACVVVYIRNSVVAVDDDTITGLNTPITVDIYGNDFDPEGDSFCLVKPVGIVNYPSNGKLTVSYLNGDSCRPMVTYQPDSNFVGLDGFCYAIIDAHGAIDTACVTINTVICINPQIVGDSVFMYQDTDTTIFVLNNDIAYGIPLTVTIDQAPAHGTVTVIGNTVYYKPNPGYVGNDYVIYRGSGICGSDTAYISYTILPVCTPIEAVNDYVLTQVNTGVAISILSNDINTNPTFVGVSVLTGTKNGVVEILNNIATYVPNNNYIGSDTFTYISCTRCGGKTFCDSARVVILIDTTLCPVPVANDDAVLSGYSCTTGFEVVTNDVNVPGTTLTIVNPGTLGTTVVNGYKIEYTPGGNSTIGQTDVITYSLCNACGKCDTATLSVRVTGFPCNGSYPVAVNDTVKACLNTVTDINVLANDYDTDGGILSLDTVYTASNGFVLRANVNTVRYVPNNGFIGTDQVVYTVCDNGTPKLCQNGIIYITVDSCVNHAPEVPATVYDTTFINVPNVTCIPVTDIDGNTVTVTNAGTPLHGTSVASGDSCIRYTPATGYTGNDTFTVVLCDNGSPSLCDTVTVIYTVVPLPDSVKGPVAVDDVASTDVSTPVVINIIGNDYDPNGDSIYVSLVPKDAPKHGITANNGNGTVTYTPDSSFVGLDSFTYTICDNGTPTLCDDATVYIYVGITPPINAVDEPCSLDSTNENQSITLNVLANDILVLANDSSLTILTDAQHGIASVNANNTVTYFPDADFTGTDQFEYVICLNLGNKSVCDTASVCITVVDTTIECTFPNAFSPNGDGVNDLFSFPCGVKYPDATFRVFNRWGNEVWYSAKYLNDWNGTNQEGKTLPDGTYFYIYEYKDGSDRKESRFVVIHR